MVSIFYCLTIDSNSTIEIMSVVLALQSAGKAVSVNAIAQQMTHFIVSSYNNVSFFVYKADWIKRIITTLQLTDTAFVNLFFLNQIIAALR